MKVIKHPNKKISLFTTLGSEAQVITTSKALLEQMGYHVEQLFIFHTERSIEPIASSMKRFENTMLNEDKNNTSNIKFIALLDDNQIPIEDFNSPHSAEVFFHSFYAELWECKQQQRIVHICASGGRKTMAMYAMVTAQLLFDEQDCFWHLFSSGEFLESKRMYPAPNDEAALIDVPVIRWGLLSPVMTILRQVQDPYVAIEMIRTRQYHEKWVMTEKFVSEQLTQAQKKVTALLVKEGLSDNQIAKRLTISSRTVERHLGEVYKKAQDHWKLEESMNRSQLISLLNVYFNTKLGEIPHDRTSFFS